MLGPDRRARHPVLHRLRLRDLPHWCADAPLLPFGRMRLSRADVVALLIALGAAIAGVVVWNHGGVDLGMTLEIGRRASVYVADVTPGGNAERDASGTRGCRSSSS